MHFWRTAVALISALALGVASQTCAGGPIQNGEFKEGRNYFENVSDKMGILSYAKNFDVTYHKAYKIVTVRNPSLSPIKFILHLCNSPKPTEEGVSTTIAVPVTKVAIADSDIYSSAYIEALYVTSPCLLKQLADNQTQVYGDGAILTGSANVGFGAASPPGSPGTVFIRTEEAIRAEASPLARAEWLKFFALFYNGEDAANALFTQVEKLYSCQSAFAKVSKSTKRVAWLRAENLNKPADKFESYDEAYTSTLISDAGMEPLKLPPASSRDKTIEVLKQTDMLVEDTYIGVMSNYSWNTLSELYVADPRDTLAFPFVGTKGLDSLVFKPDRWRTIFGVDNYIYHHWAQPDVLLNDFLFASEYNVRLNRHGRWFRAVAAGDEEVAIGADKCSPDDPAATLVFPPGLDCSAHVVQKPGAGLSTGGSHGGSAAGITIAVVLAAALGVVIFIFRFDIMDKFHAFKEGRMGHGGDPIDSWSRTKGRNGAIELQ
ncbi:hypothetical protein PhCBS80983_g03356 [Powellomyces hirtus]|uniref:Uncharacterized protein n=1 Tax=Powellomyces hirtus TaxID=109895 RepID=A0A507E4U1_9FUNG|nr:hypothetical protein PhCBS80983_g03356 [Powellomyces hirtus]